MTRDEVREALDFAARVNDAVMADREAVRLAIRTMEMHCPAAVVEQARERIYEIGERVARIGR